MIAVYRPGRSIVIPVCPVLAICQIGNRADLEGHRGIVALSTERCPLEKGSIVSVDVVAEVAAHIEVQTVCVINQLEIHPLVFRNIGIGAVGIQPLLATGRRIEIDRAVAIGMDTEVVNIACRCKQGDTHMAISAESAVTANIYGDAVGIYRSMIGRKMGCACIGTTVGHYIIVLRPVGIIAPHFRHQRGLLQGDGGTIAVDTEIATVKGRCIVTGDGV